MASYMQTTTVLLLVLIALLIRYGTSKECDYEQNSSDGHDLHVSYMLDPDVSGNFNGQTVTVNEPRKLLYVAEIKDHKNVLKNGKPKNGKARKVDPNLAKPRNEDNDDLYNKAMETGKQENDKKVKAALESKESRKVTYKTDVTKGSTTIGMMKYKTQIKDGKKSYEIAIYNKFEPKNNKFNRKPPVLKHRRQTNYLEDGKRLKSYTIATSYMDGDQIVTVVFESVIYNHEGHVRATCPKIRSLFTAVH